MLADPPNPEAIALSPLIGWLLAAAALVAALLALVHRRALARWWLSAEDPRPLALFRIVFALLLLGELADLSPHALLYFSDEGYFAADDAQELFAPVQFAGYGDGHAGDPRGFLDARGVVQHFRGQKYSLLYFHDSPAALALHQGLLVLAVLGLLVGLHTRAAALVAFVLFNSLLYRDEIFWEGTELAYRCFFAYLVVARSGHAWSVDNWRRAARLRREGRLSHPGGPGGGAGLPPGAAHPHGLEAIHRRIPAWPRRLMMLQLAAIYCYTGAVKNGAVWQAGDAFYYALNLDHFYRVPMQGASALLGTTLFRLMTWVTRWWEVLFPLVLVGHAITWSRGQALPPLSLRRRRASSLLWIALGVLALLIVVVALPVHVAERPDGPAPAALQRWTLALGLAALALLTCLVRHLAASPRALERVRVLLLSRRLWLGLGVVFQLHLVVLMNIGMFQWVMLAATLAYLDLADLRALARRLRLPALGPAEDPTLPHLHRDRRELAGPVLGAILALLAGGAAIQALGGPRLVYAGAAALALLLVAALRLRRAAAEPLAPAAASTDGTSDLAPARLPADADRLPAAADPWAYGPLGRALVGALCHWHVVAVALWMLPDKGTTSAFRAPARALAQPWVKITQTSQSWEMFAPNPPTRNAFLRVEVIDAAGERWDLRTDVYADERRPIPLLVYDRMRKVNRRVLSEQPRYRPWVARYYCRLWALAHGGAVPRRVELHQLTYTIPPPAEMKAQGPYDPRARLRTHGADTLLHTERCADAIAGQPSDELRARHGLPPAPQGALHPNAKRRKAAWDQRRSPTPAAEKE